MKAKKVAQYSDGLPTWLVTYVDTRTFFPLCTIDDLAKRQNFDPRPFDRVLAGCFTAGVSFEPDKSPRYTSLTTANTES